jgi:monovalent cation/hydrogen antiporter
MHAQGIHYVELILILLLVFVVGFGVLARKLQTPYPIILVIAGLALSFLPGMPRISLNPDLVFLGFLPPLLFSAAFATSWREFQHNLVSIFFLAFGLVGFTVVGVAVAVHWILPGFDWRSGLVLGAVVATTDPVAATAIGRNVGLPKSIIDILEGESLVNDASGLLALEFTVALMVSGQIPTIGDGLTRLSYLVFGGILIGLVIGRFVNWLEQHIDDSPIEITISIVTPFVVYLTAESLHASGVLATVTCGLYLGRKSTRALSLGARLEGRAVWRTFTFILNGILFVILGLQLPSILGSIKSLSLQRLLLSGVIFTALVIALRLIWIFPGTYLARMIRRHLLGHLEPMPPARGIFVVGWTGMRGAVALAAAISLPETLDSGAAFPQRSEILFLTFCVIFVTLVLQGLTLPMVIRRLGLAGILEDTSEEEQARRAMIDAALGHLQEIRARDGEQYQPIYEDLAQHYQRSLATLGGGSETNRGEITTDQHERYLKLDRELRKVEFATAIKLRDQNRINDEMLRKLQRELDFAEARARSL